ncbi:cytochrome P450 [Dichomitus squalens LYAD-421 SS1]|uniref:Cytochrome P450 n=1 Tax=Dichomitus squalens (strain LYAD-421) TaxID=732165 RepID=R7SJQ2_DICSQ|nr:cytochrome P450 [Dichomitus squalens LYAD-421 SS1]EJF55960.1 cytochrome P450 [Dichomitus squalens LYAD-421 SS1]
MFELVIPWLLSVAFASAFWKVLQISSRRRRLPLPPSPPSYPIIGNIFDVPTKDMHVAFRDMNVKYGDIVYLNVCGQPMIVLGTHEAATDLLEKRSANYSGRLFSMAISRSGWEWLFSVADYGTQWRKTRRLLHEYMHPNAVKQYRPIQEREVTKYLVRLLEHPKEFLHHGRHLFGAITIRAGYGIDVDTDKEIDYLEIAERAMAAFAVTFLPGKYLVELVPILRYLPSCIPGGHFKREAAEWSPIVRKMREVPWNAAMTALREGRGLPSMASGLLERTSGLDPEAAAEQVEFSKDAVAAAYTGGADTTLSTLQNIYVAMASFPEVQKRAQAELDAVVGPHRLPTFSDKEDLPYVTALIKESLRWRPVSPLALIHVSMEEDEYKGFCIPKRSAMVFNIWAYTQDPRLYPDPQAYKPERYLRDGKIDPDVQDPAGIAFGYGRRICPGRHFAEASLFAVVSKLLHTMSIEPPRDESGQPIDLAKTVKMTHGIISYPEPFECIIKPRSPEAETLIRNACSEVEAASA